MATPVPSTPLLPHVGTSILRRTAWAVASFAVLALVSFTIALSAPTRRPAALLEPAKYSQLVAAQCDTDHCVMTRACQVHAGDADSCYAVEPLCEECGERKPCYYAFGKCKLRNGYGPKYNQEDGDGKVAASAASASAAKSGLAGAAGAGAGGTGSSGESEVGGDENPIVPAFGQEEIKEGGLVTVDPRHGAHEEKTPDKVKQLANITEGEGPHLQDGPKLQWCYWGSEMVPCAPGYGGAWYEHHTEDSGVWPNIKAEHVNVRHHVKAGRRSHPYTDDILEYGEGGIFGARKIGGASVAHGKMLSGGHVNARVGDLGNPDAAAEARASKAGVPAARHVSAGQQQARRASPAQQQQQQQQQLARALRAPAGASRGAGSPLDAERALSGPPLPLRSPLQRVAGQ